MLGLPSPLPPRGGMVRAADAFAGIKIKNGGL